MGPTEHGLQEVLRLGFFFFLSDLLGLVKNNLSFEDVKSLQGSCLF